MTNLIHTETVDDLGLIYLKEEGIAGIHARGLAKLLDCDEASIRHAMVAANHCDILEAQIPTAGGIQGAKFILESGVMAILKYIRRGKFADSTKLAAEDLYDRFAEAGFKLYVMLKVEPEALREMLPEPPTPTAPETVSPPLSPIENQISMALRLAGEPGDAAIKALELIHGIVSGSPTISTERAIAASESVDDKICEAIVNYISRRTNRQSDWNAIARGVSVLRPEPGMPKSRRLNNKGNVTRLLKRIEKQGRGRWISPTIFQLND
jgi:hypothetical protein